MTERELRAVLVTAQNVPRLAERLAAALDGTGPAIAPVDAGLPPARLGELLTALGPRTVEEPQGEVIRRYDHGGVAASTAVIVTTSGSAGAPKSAELTAAALLHSARASLARLGAAPGERWLLCLPAAHIAGLQVLVRSLVSGAEPVVAAGAAPEALAGSGCAHVSLVPTQLSRLPDPGVLRGFKSVLIGGAAAAAPLLERAKAAGAPIVTTYGMTETCGGCFYDGIALEGVRARIRAGRIWLSGPVLFRGYHGQPPRDSEWFLTNDIGVIERGRLTVLGRADDVIITGGHKVYPAEVAAALHDAPGVREAAIVGQTDAEWGERVVAVVVPADPHDPPTLEMLRMHVKRRLPRYACPSRVVLVAAIPALPSGKPDLRRLRHDLATPGNGPAGSSSGQ